MKNTVSTKILLSVAAVFSMTGVVWAQDETPAAKNFGYSQNPKTKLPTETAPETTTETAVSVEKPVNTTAVPTVSAPEPGASEPNPQFESRSIAGKTRDIAKRAEIAAIAPTEIYKVGIGDVLYISLQNAPAKDSTYYTVLNDGAIDYPLAGELVAVSGLTTEEIEDTLRQKVKIYDNPQISVKVREHTSHLITVLGMVENPGEKFLQREAMPLFAVRAEAVAQPRANVVVIKRANAGTERLDLKNPKSDDVLIFPRDIVEFKSDEIVREKTTAPSFYYIGGNIVAGGQKDFHSGMTLTQAILASGGLKKPLVKKVVIRRVNQLGMLSPLEFDLDSIKGGRQPDPQLRAGDTVEIGN